MKLCTAYEPSQYSILELRILFRDVSRQLAKALASLENISWAMCR